MRKRKNLGFVYLIKYIYIYVGSTITLIVRPIADSMNQGPSCIFDFVVLLHYWGSIALDPAYPCIYPRYIP